MLPLLLGVRVCGGSEFLMMSCQRFPTGDPQSKTAVCAGLCLLSLNSGREQAIYGRLRVVVYFGAGVMWVVFFFWRGGQTREKWRLGQPH